MTLCYKFIASAEGSFTPSNSVNNQFLYFYLLQNSKPIIPGFFFFFKLFQYQTNISHGNQYGWDPLAKNLQHCNANILKILILQATDVLIDFNVCKQQ